MTVTVTLYSEPELELVEADRGEKEKRKKRRKERKKKQGRVGSAMWRLIVNWMGFGGMWVFWSVE